MADFEVRLARRTDLPRLELLWAAYMREMRRRTVVYGPPDAKARASWRRSVRASFGKKGRAFVAVAGDRVLGMLFCDLIEHEPWIRPFRVGYLSSAYVLPSHRGRGILRAMLREAEDWCGTRGVTSFAAWVLRANTEALAAWKRLGYGTSAEYLLKTPKKTRK